MFIPSLTPPFPSPPENPNHGNSHLTALAKKQSIEKRNGEKKGFPFHFFFRHYVLQRNPISVPRSFLFFFFWVQNDFFDLVGEIDAYVKIYNHLFQNFP